MKRNPVSVTIAIFSNPDHIGIGKFDWQTLMRFSVKV